MSLSNIKNVNLFFKLSLYKMYKIRDDLYRIPIIIFILYNLTLQTADGNATFCILVYVSKLVMKDLTYLREVSRRMFGRYLLLTNMAISGVLSLTGDVLQQHYEVINKKERKWDKERSFRMTASGITVGFVCHYWYLFLDKNLPGKSLVTVMKKVVIDQLVCSPVYITVFFATTCFMEGKNFKEFKDEAIHKGWRLFLADCIVWPPAQIINFYFLKPQFRVIYDNLISLGCDIYTSYVKNELSLNEDGES